MKPRFSIVTPCWNAASYIQETALSVLQQTAVLNGTVELEYLVCDGGSSDGTLEILREIDHPSLQIISEKDRGMYDALRKGLSRVTGQYVAYLNAGDYYHKCAFDVVAALFAAHAEVSWLTGFMTIYNENSQVIMVTLPNRYRRNFFANGIHGGHAPGVQQESTFWRVELLELINYNKLSTFRLAGDFYLWHQFAQKYDLYIVGAMLGGFKHHANQLSEAKAEYVQEVFSLTCRASIFEKWLSKWDNLINRFATNGIKRRLDPERHFLYDLPTGRWCKFPERTKQ